MEQSIFRTIRTNYHSFTPVQKKVADFVLTSPEKVILYSVGTLAEQCGTSEPSIFRFLRKIGYQSYQVFRVNMARALSSDSPQSIYDELTPQDAIIDLKKKVIQLTTRSISDLEMLLTDESMEAFRHALISSKRTMFMGVGASSFIAADAYHKFLQQGFPVLCCHNPHLMNMHATHASKGDFLVVISHSGESREILDAVSFAKEKNVVVAVITSYPNSALAKEANILLLSSSRESTYRSDSMISRINQLVIIDMLYVATMLKMGAEIVHNVHQSRIAVAKNKT